MLLGCLITLQADAEEVCTILKEVFQLVYTEATIRQLNESISAGERGSVMAAPTSAAPRQTPSGGKLQQSILYFTSSCDEIIIANFSKLS